MLSRAKRKRVSEMLSRKSLLKYVRAQPFRPFRILLNSGHTYEVRHPEMIKVLPDHALVFEGKTIDELEDYDMVSLLLMERVEFAGKQKQSK